MRLADLDYTLPEELIAQEPTKERSSARLFVLASDGAHRHLQVADLPMVVRSGDVLVVNDTRVIPARVHGRRPTGGRLELLFVRPLTASGAHRNVEQWEVLVRGAPRRGERVHLPEADGEWVEGLGEGHWRLAVSAGEAVVAWLDRVGDVPLPPYIRRPAGPSTRDRERYQTVYACVPGAVAAPTAGLHLTPDLLDRLRAEGVGITAVTLHVGPGTFLPIRVDDIDQHVMAAERYEVPAHAVAVIARAQAEGRRIVAVGTTTVRALESAASGGVLVAGSGEARLFIRPGFRFGVVDALLTNFHLPRSSLLALVAAFAGWDQIRSAYEEAVRQRYRFYSFGDAMFLG